VPVEAGLRDDDADFAHRIAAVSSQLDSVFSKLTAES